MTATALAPRRTLLPPQSTPLERALDQTFPQWDALADAFTVPSVGEPEQFAPWLAAEYELAQFAPYFPTTAELIEQGLQWLFTRGTAASVVRALGWVGFAGAEVDEDGAYLHINLGRPATAEEMARVAHVVRASLPAHVHFYRVFNPLNDVRRIVLDRTPRLDTGMLDGDSGVMGPDGVKLSCIQFFVCGILCMIPTILFEHPEIYSILQAWKPIAYAGIMSCGVGYTLQIVAQKNTDPTVASLLLSLESVFSVLAGWVILGETLSPRELFGCALVFAAVILAQLPERRPNLSCRDLQREESRPHHSTL